MTTGDMASGIAGNQSERSRRGVRRTVAALTVVVGAFYLLSFVQILLMK